MPLDGRALAHNVLEDMRFRAIQSYEQGRGVLEIADLLDLHWGSVSRWLTKWRRGGLKALQARRATGRPKKAGLPRAWSSYSKVGESARYAIRLRTSAMDLQTHRASDPRRAQASGIDSDAVAGTQETQAE